MGRYFEEISQDTGRFCFGVQDTMKALEMGAVETLIVWENLRTQRISLKNHNSEENKIILLSPEQEKDRTNSIDCETNVEMEVLDKVLLLEWLVENFAKFGAHLEMVTDGSQEGSQFCQGFGGIGGLLRYRVDFEKLECDETLEGLDLFDDDEIDF